MKKKWKKGYKLERENRTSYRLNKQTKQNKIQFKGEEMNREQWLKKVTEELKNDFSAIGYEVPENIRLSCGFPSTGRMSKKNTRIGECWSSSCSEDNHYEIFIIPNIADSLTVAGILVHELVHTIVGIAAQHGKVFTACARAIGLEGKATATIPGEQLTARLKEIIENLGEYPHASLSAMNNGKKKQKTNLLKVGCPDCGYLVRVTDKWLKLGFPICPCGSDMVKLS